MQCAQWVLEQFQVELWDDAALLDAQLYYPRAAQAVAQAVQVLRSANGHTHRVEALMQEMCQHDSMQSWSVWSARALLPLELTGWPIPTVPLVVINAKGAQK